MNKYIHYAIVFFFCLICLKSYSQTFGNYSVSACGSWNSSNSWTTALTKNISVSGLPTIGLGSTSVLRQVNIQLGNATCKGNLSSYQVRLVDPNGIIDTLIAGVTTSISAVWLNVKLRDHSALERIKDYSTTTQGSYYPYSIGYYKSNKTSSYTRFNNSNNPNGNWQIQIIENVSSSEVSFEKAELIFGSPFSVNDITGSNANDSCGGAVCIKNNEIVIGTNKGYVNGDPRYPGSPVNGCDWNSANNNSAWFQFTAGSTTANITLSGLLNPGSSTSNKVQAVVLQAPTNCTITPTVVPTGGCPKATVNNADYWSTNGGGTSTFNNIYFNGIIANMNFNLSGLTPCQRYYLYIDGEGGDTTTFYLEYNGGTTGGVATTIQKPTCNMSNGKIKLTAPCAGSTFTWSANAGVSGNKDSAINLAAGTYSVTVSNGACPIFDTTIVLVSDSLKWTMSKTNPNCGMNNGNITINVTSSGTSSYNWSSNAGVGNVNTANNLVSGTYKVTITQNGCIDSATIILPKDSLKWSIVKTLPTCGQNNGSITVNVISSGTVTYNWSSNAGVGNVNSATGLGAGTYKVTVSQYGCIDSTTVIFAGLSNINRDTLSYFGCLAYTYKTKNYNKDTFVIDTIKSKLNTACDSIIRRVNIDIKDTISSISYKCIVSTDSVLFNGIYRKNTGLYLDTTINSQGCDSFIRLNLISIVVNNISKDSLGCDSILWKGIYYKTNSSFKDTIKSILGCDSIVTTTLLKISYPISQSNSLANCDSVQYKSKKYFSNTTIIDTIKKSIAPYCDSIYNHITITIYKKDTTKFSACINTGKTYVFYGNSITVAGLYYHKLSNINGCDSFIELNLKLMTPTTFPKDTNACKSLIYKGKSYVVNTTIQDTIQSYQGCDSIYNTLNIIIYTTNSTTNNIQGCDTVIFKSKIYKVSSLVIDTIKKTVSPFCDSIYTQVQITVYKRDTIQKNACFNIGGTYNFYGTSLTTSGVYFKKFTNNKGCDSFIRLALVTIMPVIINKDTAACSTFQYKNKTYTTNSIILDTIKSNQGCDSIFKNLKLTIYNPIKGKNDTIRSCEKIQFNGSTYTSNATISVIIKKQTAPYCDSISKNVVLIIYPKPNGKISVTPDTIVKQGNQVTLLASGGTTYIWSINNSTASKLIYTMHDRTYFEVKITDKNSCDTIIGVWISVESEIEIPEAFSPNGDGINDFIYPIVKGPVEIKSYKIYNRWGQIIYEGLGSDAKWDGKFRGEEQPQGSYVYFVEYILSGKTISKIGGLTLIK